MPPTLLLLAETASAPWRVAVLVVPAAGAIWGAVSAVARVIKDSTEARIAAERDRTNMEREYRDQLVSLYEERERKLREDLVIITRFIDVLTSIKNRAEADAAEDEEEPPPPEPPRRGSPK
jgi:hypothetical protein